MLSRSYCTISIYTLATIMKSRKNYDKVELTKKQIKRNLIISLHISNKSYVHI